MSKIAQLWRIATHLRELRLALSGLGMRLGGDEAMGGLTSEETDALVRWTKDAGVGTFVEIGTLFGLTARTVSYETGKNVIAVDNFCWNPFGLTAAQHEAFARRIVAGSGVDIVNSDAIAFLKSLSSRVDVSRALVFLDGSHAYGDVKREIETCVEQGARFVAGHDFGNERFGVTKAVREVVGEPDEVCGMCWIRRLADG